MPMRRAAPIDLTLSAAMKRARICGWPKYPSPQAAVERMPIKVVPVQRLSYCFPVSCATAAMAACICAVPPSDRYTMTGVRISAKSISVACTVSVQLTARKPPMKV